MGSCYGRASASDVTDRAMDPCGRPANHPAAIANPASEKRQLGSEAGAFDVRAKVGVSNENMVQVLVLGGEDFEADA